jgi:putative CocE/NonD family hydrolase
LDRISRRWIVLWLLCIAFAGSAPAADRGPLPVPPTALASRADTDAWLPELARALLARDDDPRIADPNQRFRLLFLAGRLPEAVDLIRALRAERLRSDPATGAALFVQHELVATALIAQQSAGLDWETAFARSFDATITPLDDRSAYTAAFALGTSLQRLTALYDAEVARLQGRSEITVDEALALLRVHLPVRVYERLPKELPALLAADERRRYVIDREVLVGSGDGTPVAALMMRPRGAARRTTLFTFTIYANDDWAMDDLRRMAAHGYAAVVGYTRGKGRSPVAPQPYEHDGDDARAVIEWIAAQPWSDGRVGMYGGSYSAFTQWAVAKRLPKALKAMATSASVAPGIDVPMEGGVFMNFVYPWIAYATNGRALDDAAYGDRARWQKLDRDWYAQGSAYRGLDRIDGVPNPLHRRWLEHPGYDRYWQQMIPYRDEFAAVDIPVLATTGYFDGGQVGVLYYFDQHLRHRPHADHTLLIGPWGHFAMQAGTPPVESGYAIDPSGAVDLQALRLQWFDHVFRGAAKAALLKDRVNYQVMGADVWRHAPTLAAMHDATRRYYIAPRAKGGEHHRLTTETQRRGAGIELVVDFARRDDVDAALPELRQTKAPFTRNALAFVSAPLEAPLEVSGLFSGTLAFVVNKKDVDLAVTLYEAMPSGEYFELASYMRRASYARDRTHRRLLELGKRQRLNFTAERIVSRRLQAGSRIVAVLGVVKQRDVQINYGSGKDVSDETIADAGAPLRLRWLPGTRIDVPVRVAP